MQSTELTTTCRYAYGNASERGVHAMTRTAAQAILIVNWKKHSIHIAYSLYSALDQNWGSRHVLGELYGIQTITPFGRSRSHEAA